MSRRPESTLSMMVVGERMEHSQKISCCWVFLLNCSTLLHEPTPHSDACSWKHVTCALFFGLDRVSLSSSNSMATGWQFTLSRLDFSWFWFKLIDGLMNCCYSNGSNRCYYYYYYCVLDPFFYFSCSSLVELVVFLALLRNWLYFSS